MTPFDRSEISSTGISNLQPPTSQEPLCVHDLIAAQARKTPDTIALMASGKTVSYAQLNSNANKLAHFLRARGVGPELLVGLCLKRSAEMLLGMLGILKAGGAYIPFDPNDPLERQSFKLQDSGTRIVVTTEDLASHLPLDGKTVVRVDADWPEISRESAIDPKPVACGANPAYIIYTSGSTGKPKGVIVLHSGLLNYLVWAARAYGKEACRSALIHSSVSFDLTITGIFTPLLLGGTVELMPDDDADLEAVVQALRQPQTRGLVKITPAHLQSLSQQLRPDEVAGKVGLFVIGGENLLAQSLRFWRDASPTTRLINEYGPTETVVGCCIYEVQRGDPLTGSVPIGTAIDNTQLYVLDRQLKPVDPGVAGELYIAGAGVARGYLNQPELTREHFLPDPFSNQIGTRMYKTGDMVRCRENGILEYLGRLDNQIKIRGYRVEPGEIEAVLAEHPSVQHCVAVARTSELNGQHLAGYVILQDGQQVTVKELREFLRLKLPEYMVPAYFAFLEAFPMTSRGKVDRHALAATKRSGPQHEFISPRNLTESKLATVFTEVLGVSPIGITDNFFDLGGDSLAAMTFLGKVELLFGKRPSMRMLFQAATIEQFAVALEQHNLLTPQVIPVQPGGSLPPFFCIGAGPLFRPLASRLGAGRPFLSLMPSLLPELKRLSAPYQLDQIAAHLVSSILDYQKEGPYYLGGWSASGVVAYETARQLVSIGHEVAVLFIFDTANPAFGQDGSIKSWLASRVKKIKFHAGQLVRLKVDDVPTYLSEKVKELQRKISAWQLQHKDARPLHGASLENADQIVHLAVRRYRPPPYPGRLVYFKAAERPAGDAWDMSLGWSHLVTEFEAYEVPGDHRSMFLEPNVELLANYMRNKLGVSDQALLDSPA